VPGPPLLRRRTVLLGTAAVTAVTAADTAGCDHGDDIGAPAQTTGPTTGANAGPSGGTSAPPSASPSPAQTADEALVEQVTGELTAALGVAESAARVPRLRGSVAPVVRAHRDHLRALGTEPTPAPPGPRVDAASALRQVRRSETQLQGSLVEAAGRAESGALARLLASMSASATQHVAVLPAEVSRAEVAR
jgi:hypothetical protein